MLDDVSLTGLCGLLLGGSMGVLSARSHCIIVLSFSATDMDKGK